MSNLAVRPRFFLALVFGLCVSTIAASATTIGNDSSSAGSDVDGCPNCGYILGQAANTQGTLYNYSFFAQGTGDITPVILSGNDHGDGTITFTVTGVGTTRSYSGVDQQETALFDTVSGSNAIAPNSYFGFYDSTGALVTYLFNNNGPGTYLVGNGFGYGDTFTLNNPGLDFNNYGALDNRNYQINATVTPEPSTLSLLSLGLVGVGSFARRRFQRNA